MSRFHYLTGPFPFNVGHRTPGVQNPLGLSLADAVKYYWRVKQVKMTLTYSGTQTNSYQDVNNDGGYTTYTLAVKNLKATALLNVCNVTSGNPITDETQLVLPSCFGTGAAVSYDLSGVTTSPGGATITTVPDYPFYLQLFQTSSYDAGQNACVLLSGGLLYPTISLDVGAAVNARWPDGTLGGVGIGAIINAPTYGVTPVPGTCTFDGHTLPVNFYYNGAGYTGVSASLDIEVTEYWPYADANGNPLYDTTTGAML